MFLLLLLDRHRSPFRYWSLSSTVALPLAFLRFVSFAAASLFVLLFSHGCALGRVVCAAQPSAFCCLLVFSFNVDITSIFRCRLLWVIGSAFVSFGAARAAIPPVAAFASGCQRRFFAAFSCVRRVPPSGIHRLSYRFRYTVVPCCVVPHLFSLVCFLCVLIGFACVSCWLDLICWFCPLSLHACHCVGSAARCFAIVVSLLPRSVTLVVSCCAVGFCFGVVRCVSATVFAFRRCLTSSFCSRYSLSLLASSSLAMLHG